MVDDFANEGLLVMDFPRALQKILDLALIDKIEVPVDHQQRDHIKRVKRKPRCLHSSWVGQSLSSMTS